MPQRPALQHALESNSWHYSVKKKRCNVYARAGDNPLELTGALVHGQSANGAFVDARTSPQHTGVSLLNNSPLSLLIAALRSRGLAIEDCIGLRPREKLTKSTTMADGTASEGGAAAQAEAANAAA